MASKKVTKATISLSVSAGQKKSIMDKAKAAKLSVSEYIISQLDLETAGDKKLFDFDEGLNSKVMDALRNVLKKEAGAVPIEVRNAANLLYTPDLWYFSPKELAEKVGATEKAVEKILEAQEGYTLFNPKRKDSKTKERLEELRKKLSMYAAGEFTKPSAVFEKIFGEADAKHVLLVKKLDPLGLKKFCSENPEKKVIYIFNW